MSLALYNMSRRVAAQDLARANGAFSTPAHKQTDPAKYPGQVVPNPPSKLYKPAHGGYPTTNSKAL